MNKQSQIVDLPQRPLAYMPTVLKVAVQPGECIASDEAMAAIEVALEIRAQIKMLNKQLELNKELIVAEMGKNKVMVDCHGRELCTYKQNSPSEIVDKDKFKLKFPDVYNQIAELKEGSWVLNFK